MKTNQQEKANNFLQGGGEMGKLTREFNWGQTSLGSPETWQQSLKTTVSNLLRSKFPMFLWWGKEMIQFYNDAYRPSLGEGNKHPSALGARGKETWPETWNTIFPLMQQVEETGVGTWMENQLVPIHRNGKLEEVYWTFSYSSVLDDEGIHAGILVTCIETTYAVKLRSELTDKAEHFHNMIEQAPVAIAVTSGEDMIFRNINPYMLKIIHKKNKEEVLGKKLEEVLPELSGQHVYKILQDVIHTGETFKGLEIKAELISGFKRQKRYFNITYTRLKESEGNYSVMHMAVDVTEHVVSKEKLQESESRFRLMADVSPNMIWMLNPEGSYKFVNQTTLNYLGVSQNDIAEFGWEVYQHPDELAQSIETVQKTFQQENKLELEHRLKSHTGEYRWVLTQAAPAYDNDGNLYAYVGTSIDIHDQKMMQAALLSSEMRFRNMVEQAPVAILLTRGKDLVIESVNSPMIQFFNGKEIKDVLGKKMVEVLPELIGQPALKIVQNVQQTGISYRGDDQPVDLLIGGVLKRYFFNFSYTSIKEEGKEDAVLHVAIDVTQQVITRRKIEESEAKLRSIINSAPTAICVFAGAELIIENPNQLMIDVLAAGNDIEGKSFRALLPGLVEDAAVFESLIENVFKTGETFEAREVKVYFKQQNHTRYFNVSFIPLFDENKNVYAVLDVSVDVTDQVLSAQKLAASESKLRSLFEQAPFATALYIGEELKIDIINDAMLKLWDKPHSIIGKTFEQALPELKGQPFINYLQKAWKTGIEFIATGEHADMIKNGKLERGWYNYNYKPLKNENGEVYAILHMAVDVTEQVLAQKKIEENKKDLTTALEQVRLSKEAAELGTFDLDLNNNKMHWDERCRHLFGITGHEPVSFEEDFLERLHPADKKRVMLVIAKAYDKSVSNGNYDVEYRTIGKKDGKELWVRAKGKVYFDESDNPVRFIGSVLDITEQKTALQRIEQTVLERTGELAKANESLQAINKELQRSNQNLEEFAHAASHDLKEPIRKIQFYTNKLKTQLSHNLAETEMKSFVRIENASERMGNLIDDLLLYSHVSQRPHETDWVNLKMIMNRVLEDLELDISDKNAVINVGVLPKIKGYSRQLQQMFQNLISNAIKYSVPGVSPVIQIQSDEVMEEGKAYCRIRFKDNGIGIAEEFQDKIFQMFARLHSKTEYSGTGVGLSIVKKVVENHHGFIRVNSKQGEGSVFEVYLPL